MYDRAVIIVSVEQIYAVEIAAKEDRGFVSSFTLMTGNFFGLLAVSGLVRHEFWDNITDIHCG